jgi:hypothetical protein
VCWTAAAAGGVDGTAARRRRNEGRATGVFPVFLWFFTRLWAAVQHTVPIAGQNNVLECIV